MKVNNILYLTDSYLYLRRTKNTEIIKETIPKHLVKEGKITSITKFLKFYEKLLTKNNLNRSLFGENIKIIVGPNYSNADISTLKNLFNQLNYRKIVIEIESKYYKLNQKNAILNVFDSYAYLTYIDDFKEQKTITISNNMFKNNQDLMAYIKYIIEDKTLYLLGYGEVINDIFNHFENRFTNETFLYFNHDIYLISQVKMAK